ncbi:hypothetical protein ACVOMV_28775 [Mesorhizobium atlanticum]
MLQVGVKAPGTPNSTTFLPAKISSPVIGLAPSAVITLKFDAGSFSPTEMVMGSSLARWGDRCLRYRTGQLPATVALMLDQGKGSNPSTEPSALVSV